MEKAMIKEINRYITVKIYCQTIFQPIEETSPQKLYWPKFIMTSQKPLKSRNGCY